MKKWYEIKNYRKKYERFYGEEIPEGYDVHHLDMNRNNNSIVNLVAVPKEVHRRYHKAIVCLELSMIGGCNSTAKNMFAVDMSNGAFNMDEKLIQEAIDATNDLTYYVRKNYERFYESLMLRSKESCISEIIIRNM